MTIKVGLSAKKFKINIRKNYLISKSVKRISQILFYKYLTLSQIVQLKKLMKTKNDVEEILNTIEYLIITQKA